MQYGDHRTTTWQGNNTVDKNYISTSMVWYVLNDSIGKRFFAFLLHIIKNSQIILGLERMFAVGYFLLMLNFLNSSICGNIISLCG